MSNYSRWIVLFLHLALLGAFFSCNFDQHVKEANEGIKDLNAEFESEEKESPIDVDDGTQFLIHVNGKPKKIDTTYIGTIDSVLPSDFFSWKEYGFFAAQASPYLYGASNGHTVTRNKQSSTFFFRASIPI